MENPESYLTHIREIALLPGERVSHLFCPDRGLAPEPPGSGQFLAATNQRILAFLINNEKGDIFIVPLEDLQGVSLKSGTRSISALFQGIIFIVGAIFIYLVLAYWLTGRFQGPNVPFLNMDAGTLLVMVAVLLGAFYIARHYFSRQSGEVTFQGASWVFSFPFMGEQPQKEMYQVVNSIFADRRAGIAATFRR